MRKQKSCRMPKQQSKLTKTSEKIEHAETMAKAAGGIALATAAFMGAIAAILRTLDKCKKK
jgi:hypothetical protein